MSDHDALLRAILEQPDDDTTRLVYADYLQEHGQEHRAQFIRTMIAHPDPYRHCLSPIKVNQHSARQCGKCDVCKAMNAMRAHFKEWTPDMVCTVVIYNHASTRGHWHHDNPEMRFARGFVSELLLPTAAFLRDAGTIFAAHPIERVRLTDKSATTNAMARGAVTCWWKDQSPEQDMWPVFDYYLPALIFDRLTAGKHCPNEGGMAFRRYPLRQCPGDDDLSQACVAYGRSLVGLPVFIPATT